MKTDTPIGILGGKTMRQRLETFLALGKTKKDVLCLFLSGIALLVSLFDFISLPFDAAWIAIVLCGLPIVLEAVIGLITVFDIKADVLVSMALIASVMIGEHFAAGEIVFIMQIGALLEDLTVAKARTGMERLVYLTPRTARVLRDGEEIIQPVQEVCVGDVLRVLPGETVPVDGVILSGQTAIYQAVITGESLPVDKMAEDEVFSGTSNQFGAFTMRASSVDEDSSIQRIIRLMQSADAGKAKIVGIADRWATWIVVIALAAAALTWLITGEMIRSVTILVVFCPCAFVLATPTAIVAAIGNATKHGFLVREGDALERLANVSCITLDKTGTLTYGVPRVAAVHSISTYSEDEVYQMVAAAEQFSEHPLGKAIVQCYRQEKRDALPLTENFHMIPGQGVWAVVDGKRVLAGNLKLFSSQASLSLPSLLTERVERYLAYGCTVIYIGIEEEMVGFLALSDAVREQSADMLHAICAQNIQPVLLTGDTLDVAEVISKQLGIREIRAGCLPEDKLRYIENCQKQGKAVCMIGDGINDAPALKKANVGIAMGGIGSDIAVDAADIALVDDEIRELPHLLALSRHMMTTIKRNLTFSMTLNVLAIGLAITGILNPVVGALVHNAGSVAVIINSALLIKWKQKLC